MRVLVTGGAGFIGSAVAERLAKQGHDVVVLDNLSHQIHGDEPFNSPLVARVANCSELLVGDVTSRDTLTAALNNVDAVLHLAAETGTGQSMYEIERYARVNVGGTALLLDILANGKAPSVKKVVVASSRAVYGEGRYLSAELGYVYPESRSEVDMAEGRFEPVVPGALTELVRATTPEDAPTKPSSIYGITKHTQETMVLVVGRSLGIAPVALRYQNVYGPGQSLSNPYTGILSIFSTQMLQGKPINIFEDGKESRDFVYIDDVADATVAAITTPGADGHVVNVGSGVGTSVSEVVDQLMAEYGVHVPVTITGNFRLGDIRHNVADIERARKLLGFEPRVSFADGLAAFAAWVKTQEAPASDYEGSLAEMRGKGLLK